MSDSDMNAQPGDSSARQPAANIPLLEELVNQLLSLELAVFLEDDRCQPEGSQSDNKRNGYYYRIFKSPVGEIHIRVPRDRNGLFHPQLLPKKHSIIPDEETYTVFDLFLREPEEETLTDLVDLFYKEKFSDENSARLSHSLIEAVREYHEDLKSKSIPKQ